MEQAAEHLVAALTGVKTQEALKDLLDRYVGLVECGDCGNWDVEKEAEVIAARLALTGVLKA